MVMASCSKWDQEPSGPQPASTGTVVYTEGVYSLSFTNKDTRVVQSTIDKMVEVFFKVYPKMSERFNPNSAKGVSITIDPNLDGVAYTSGGEIVVAGTWMKDHPNDVDVVTHEVFHVVQSYSSNNPGWAVEGLADYARYKYGIYNDAGGWSMPQYSTNQSYTDSYRVTARFFVWLENHIRPTILTELDSTMRTSQYYPEFWTERTGKTVDQLWMKYGNNPGL